MILRHSFFRYTLIGVLSVAIDFVGLYILFTLVSLNMNISISIAFILSTVFNFFMHKIYTFKTKGSSFHQITKYILLISVSYLITLYGIIFLVSLDINLFLAKLIIVSIVYLYGYIFGRFFVFKE